MGSLYKTVHGWDREMLRIGIQVSERAKQKGNPDVTFAEALLSTESFFYARKFAEVASEKAHLQELPDYLAAQTFVSTAEMYFMQKSKEKLLPLPPQGMKDLQRVMGIYRTQVFADSEDAYHKTVFVRGAQQSAPTKYYDEERKMDELASQYDSSAYLSLMNEYAFLAIVDERLASGRTTPFTDAPTLIKNLHSSKVVPKLQEWDAHILTPETTWNKCRDAYQEVLLGLATVEATPKT
ncbi:MAG: hypothetical protein ABIA93_05275 [Candidatus Woesearchaeota archaeon]